MQIIFQFYISFFPLDMRTYECQVKGFTVVVHACEIALPSETLEIIIY